MQWDRIMDTGKGDGAILENFTTSFALFYSDWIYREKEGNVTETTFQNYVRSIKYIQELFGDIQLRHLDKYLVQDRINKYAEGRAYLFIS